MVGDMRSGEKRKERRRYLAESKNFGRETATKYAAIVGLGIFELWYPKSKHTRRKILRGWIVPLKERMGHERGTTV